MQAGEPYRAQAWYALETLLLPLDLRPDADLDGGIWYGTGQPPGDHYLHIPLDPDTPGRITSNVRGTDSAGAPAWVFAGDPIASAFYWLAGCDYQANPSRDRFGRVTAAGSLLEERGLLKEAPVDQLRDWLAERLRAIGVPVQRRRWGTNSWCLVPTTDVDYLRKWRAGIWWRELVEYLLLGRGPGRQPGRLVRGLRESLPGQDPFQRALRRMRQEVEARSGRLSVLFKTGATSAHDVEYRLDSPFALEEVQALKAGGHDIGLHPSFHAYNHPAYLRREVEALRLAVQQPLRSVRSHYLRWQEATTAAAYAEAGFGVDSTLGFPDAAGFRNGTCLPFRPWNHVRNEPEPIQELPLALMESALFNRRGLNAEYALQATAKLIDRVRLHGGACVALWHNVLWDEMDYPGWGSHFLGTLDLAIQQEATIESLAGALTVWG
ncbi:MAG: polysaccharide deacetylase family protein [Rhodothermales bacterium]|nr:polysaccharide deacetylase family protein [Rhodothermales bacterium]